MLIDGKIVKPKNMLEYVEWEGDSSKRIIAQWEKGKVLVSTVFLGLDHNHRSENDPILFETMIFGGKYDNAQWRYRTLEAAKVHHDQVVAALKAKRKPPDPE